eukprot:TRINITY_DN328_c0_g1_i1.p1 TRINITY_DN328_c0_g1~~TRINITY_DN328_c0_g1_i1.p1  ORF type:complete len:2552 (-),score=636.12 TRINITY_DN328_c0_g1_i1:69-7724(-)
MKGITLLVPLLLLAIVFAQEADYAVYLSDQTAGVPYVEVDSFTFGANQYTIMAHGRIDKVSSNSRALFHAWSDASIPPSNDLWEVLVAIKNTNKLIVNFGKGDQEITCGNLGISPNVMFSFILTVSKETESTVSLNAIVNGKSVCTAVVDGYPTSGSRKANLGATKSLTNPWDGVIDNFLIRTGVPTNAQILSHVNTKDWSPTSDELRKLNIWLGFDDSYAQLEDTTVAVVTLPGQGSVSETTQSWVEAKIRNGASFTPHVVSDQWESCRATGDPHFYDRRNTHIYGGEHQKGGNVFYGCYDVEAEVRTFTRYTIWWGATVFRTVTLRYQDYVWRISLDERHSSPDDTRAGTPYVRLGCDPGTFIKHIHETAWTAIGDGTRIHEETGVRYSVSGGRNKIVITIPSTLVLTVQGHTRHMAVYLDVNAAICSDIAGACDHNMDKKADIFFRDWLAPTELEDVDWEQNDLCDTVATETLDIMKARCRSYYPTDDTLYGDCLYDACGSGDPDMIPETEITSECLMSRLIGDGSSCTVTKCTNACYGRGTCNEATGVCEGCEAGYSGNDCYQQNSFNCMTVTYGNIFLNVEPTTIINNGDSTVANRFADYTVFRSVLIDPVTLAGQDYLKFVVSSVDNQFAGSVNICINARGTDALPGAPQFVTKPTSTSLGTVSLSGSWSGRQLCVDVTFPAFSTGGFFIPLNGPHDLEISVTNKNNIEQVLFSSKNNKGGVDVAKVPEAHHSSFNLLIEDCDNTQCTQHDGDCNSCYQQANCGYCLESQRCMRGGREGPKRGICRNWRFGLDDVINRVVTTIYNGDDLVDPDYEVFLQSSNPNEAVPVNIYVPTGRTNNNVDVHFVLGTAGDYPLYAQSLKSNVLNALSDLGDYNLGIGYYSAVGSKTTLTMTFVHPNNKYLFGRAMEAPTNLVTTNVGGQLSALKKVAVGASVGFREHSRRIVTVLAYDYPTDTQIANELADTRSAVLSANFLTIWLVPADSKYDAVADKYQSLADSLTGIPALVLRIDKSGSNFLAVFKNAIKLAQSFPHVVLTEDASNPNQYTNFDMNSLNENADALQIFGLSNTLMRARFPFAILEGDHSGVVARITIPGFGGSEIKDVESQRATAVSKLINANEGDSCISVTLAASTYNTFTKPVFNIVSLPSKGTLHIKEAGDTPGALATTGYTTVRSYCFVAEDEYDFSIPEGSIYASIVYTATDGCQQSETATIDIIITDVPQQPVGEDIEITIKETDQTSSLFFDVTGFEPDKDATTGSPQQISFEYISTTPASPYFGSIGNVLYFEGSQLQYSPSTYTATPSAANHYALQNLEYRPISEDFFGVISAKYQLTDASGLRSSRYYKVRIVVEGVNDEPTVDRTNGFQFTSEDTPFDIQLFADDIDSTAVGIDVQIVSIQGTGRIIDPRDTNVDLPVGEWIEDVCVGGDASYSTSCLLKLIPGANENSCTETDPALVSTNCVNNGYVELLVRANDHNSKWEPFTEALSTQKSVTVHVTAVNDAPNQPDSFTVYFKEDQAGEIVRILASDIDSEAVDLDIFLDNVPNQNKLQLFQITPTGDVATQILSAEEINDFNLKRAVQQHGFYAVSMPDVHGVAPTWELATIDFHAFDGSLPSTSAQLTFVVKPINDAPVPNPTTFTKAEDDQSSAGSIIILSAEDVDNEESELVYTVISGPGIVGQSSGPAIYHVAYDEFEDKYFQAAPVFPGDVIPRVQGKAMLWFSTQPDFYTTVPNELTLTYTITDVDNFLDETDEDYTQNVVTAEMDLIVTPVNDPPAIQQSYEESTDEDTPLVVFLFAVNNYYGEQDDVLQFTLVSKKNIFKDNTVVSEGGFYQYDIAYLARLSEDITDLDPSLEIVGENVTLNTNKFIWVPPKNFNSDVDMTSPLYVSASYVYKVTEISTHDGSPGYTVFSQETSVTVNAVNDAPVVYGGNWESDESLDNFYGIQTVSGVRTIWPESDYCYDSCSYSEDFGVSGYLEEARTEDIYFGGRDVEGDNLRIKLTAIDCAPGVVLEEKLSTGSSVVSAEELIAEDRYLTQTISRSDGGDKYILTSGLSFQPVVNDWNLPGSEGRVPTQSGNPDREHYCTFTYAVVDSEGSRSEEKTISIDITQVNDQPIEEFNLPEISAEGYYSVASAITKELYAAQNGFIRLYFNASDVEGDDFIASMYSCGTRGSFYLPSATQSDSISETGVIVGENTDLFDMENPIDCGATPVQFTKTFVETGSKGWYLLFVPLEGDNEIGLSYNTFTVAYDDQVVAGQTPTLVTRNINVKKINTSPTLYLNDVAIDGDNIFPRQQDLEFTVEPGKPFSLDLGISDPDAIVGRNSYSDFYFRIAATQYPEGLTTEQISNLAPYSMDLQYFIDYSTVLVTNLALPSFGSTVTNGMVEFRGTVAKMNSSFPYLLVVPNYEGTYVFEVVAVDNGRAGICPQDLVIPAETYPSNDIRGKIGRNGTLISGNPERCNREVSAIITVNVQYSTTTLAVAGSAFGAVFLGLVAAGAVAITKLTKPESTDAWNAFDNVATDAMVGNSLFQTGVSTATNELYVSSIDA